MDEAFQQLAAFGHELRDAGVTVGTGQVAAYCRALVAADPTNLEELYYVGRACLINRRADLAVYDQVFARHFLGTERFRVELRIEGQIPKGRLAGIDLRGSGRERARERESPPAGQGASAIEILRDKDFAACTDEELDVLRRLMAEVMVALPDKRTRRAARARVGDRLDLRRALRGAIRHEGMVFPLRWRQRRTKPRTLVLLLDVSGSMADYSRALLQFAHIVGRGPGRVEVFCFGTRLSRITDALGGRDPDEALAAAAATVLDWEGGTLIGESVREYVRTWGRRGGFRGAVVVVCSDGLERGDPGVLGEEMARLARLAHQVVWVNPLKGGSSFEPTSRGMQAALPHLDLLVSGHNLASLRDLAGILPALR